MSAYTGVKPRATLPVDSDMQVLTDVERKIKDVITVIENGDYGPALNDRLDLRTSSLRERPAMFLFQATDHGQGKVDF